MITVKTNVRESALREMMKARDRISFCWATESYTMLTSLELPLDWDWVRCDAAILDDCIPKDATDERRDEHLFRAFGWILSMLEADVDVSKFVTSAMSSFLLSKREAFEKLDHPMIAVYQEDSMSVVKLVELDELIEIDKRERMNEALEHPIGNA